MTTYNAPNERTFTSDQLSYDAEKAMDRFSAWGVTGNRPSWADMPDDPEYVAAGIIDGVFDNDHINDGPHKWDSVSDMAEAYVIDYDKETMEQNIDTSTFDCIKEAKTIVEEVLKLTGNL